MKTKILKALVLVFLLGSVSAYATIMHTASGTFARLGGPDTLDLHGKVFTLISTWDSAAIYIDRFGQPTTDALSHSFNVSGAGTTSSNGAWTDPQGLAIYPINPGQLFGGGQTNLFSEFLVNGIVLTMNNLVKSTVGASIGGPISPTHFGTTQGSFQASGYFNNFGDGSSYGVLEFSAGVSESNGGSVPEPTTILLMGLGLAGLGFHHRARRRCFSMAWA